MARPARRSVTSGLLGKTTSSTQPAIASPPASENQVSSGTSGSSKTGDSIEAGVANGGAARAASEGAGDGGGMSEPRSRRAPGDTGGSIVRVPGKAEGPDFGTGRGYGRPGLADHPAGRRGRS